MGAGNMAAAMARGLGGRRGRPGGDAVQRRRIGASGGAGRRARGRDARRGSPSWARDSDLVVLAVKPDALDSRRRGARPEAPRRSSRCSARPRSSRLEAGLSGRSARSHDAEPRGRGPAGGDLPQTPVAVPPPLGAEILGAARAARRTVEVEEDLIDAATAVMGCSPAYFALIAEALAEAGSRGGPRPRARARARRWRRWRVPRELLGSASPRHLRNAVASPGGSTEAGPRGARRRRWQAGAS